MCGARDDTEIYQNLAKLFLNLDEVNSCQQVLTGIDENYSDKFSQTEVKKTTS